MENSGIGSWLQRRRPKSGSKTALIFGDHQLSYEEFAERSDKLANALNAGGVAKGDRVAYLGENHPSFLETLFACGQLGAIFVPLNTRLAPPELTFQLEDCGAVALIHSASLSGLAASAAEGTRVSRRIVVGDSFPHRNTAAVSDTGNEPPTAADDYEDVVASGAPLHVDAVVGLDDGAMILYTSGTTGRPKGALLTHGNITWNCINVVVDFDFSSSDVALMISPMFHVASLDMGVLPTLLKGEQWSSSRSSTPNVPWNSSRSTGPPPSAACPPPTRCSASILHGRRRTSAPSTS